MLQTLFYIPDKFFGLPVFGFGLLLAVWAVASVAILAWLMRLHGFDKETWGYVPLLLVVGAAIWLVLPAVCKPEGLPIRGYGVMLLIAVLSGAGLTVWRAHRRGIDTDMVVTLLFWLFIAGIVGARVFYIIEYWDNYQRATLGETVQQIVNITEGGLVVYGSLIGGIAALLIFAKRHRLPFLATCDLIAPGMVLGLAFGRIGCLLNGCCFGGPSDLPWAVTFPPNTAPYETQVARGQMYGFQLALDPDGKPTVSRVDPGSLAAKAGLHSGDCLQSINDYPTSRSSQAQTALIDRYSAGQSVAIQTTDGRSIRLAAVPIRPRSLPVQPTQIYGSLNGLVLLFLLLAYEPFQRREGEVFALLVTVYPVTRFLLEIIRTDESSIFGTGLSISQNVSLLFLAGVAALWYYILRQPSAAPGRS